IAEQTADGTQQVALTAQQLSSTMEEFTDSSQNLKYIAEDLQNGIAAFILVDDHGQIKRSILRKEQLRQKRSSKQSMNRQKHMSNLMDSMFSSHNLHFKNEQDIKGFNLKDKNKLEYTPKKEAIKKKTIVQKPKEEEKPKSTDK